MRKIIAVLGFALASLTFTANAELLLKSSGDQWGPAIQDLQLSYNEGVPSGDFTRFYNTLSSRFNLNGSTAQDILDAFKNGADTSSQTVFNGSLPSGGSNTGGGGTTGPQGPKGDKGDKGDKGVKGDVGIDGASAFEVAQNAGFQGT